jgi:hypothetical protein
LRLSFRKACGACGNATFSEAVCVQHPNVPLLNVIGRSPNACRKATIHRGKEYMLRTFLRISACFPNFAICIKDFFFTREEVRFYDLAMTKVINKGTRNVHEVELITKNNVHCFRYLHYFVPHAREGVLGQRP